MDTLFLAIFVFGALFTIASAVLGTVGTFDHGFHLGGQGDTGAHTGGHDSLQYLSGSSVIGGLTWFGAAGFVLVRLSEWALPAVLLGAVLGGVVGGYLVARFLKLILSGERTMDPADYRLEGTIGQLTVSIPAGGTGEVVFSKVGARRSEAARSVDGAPIPRGTEVVITRYVDGFATVEPWAELIASRDDTALAEAERRKRA